MTESVRPAAEEEVFSAHPIVIFIGPLGVGKTELAINYSLAALRSGRATCLVDLDIVTPYFRVGDYRSELSQAGLRIIAPLGSLASYETPALSPEIAGALQASDVHTVVDVGGDAHGARLLGVYAPHIRERARDVWLVVNPFRQGSSGAAVSDQCTAMEAVTGLRVTGLIANPHLGAMTEPHHLQSGWDDVERLAHSLRLPVVRFAVMESLAGQAPDVGVPRLLLRPRVTLPWETR